MKKEKGWVREDEVEDEVKRAGASERMVDCGQLTKAADTSHPLMPVREMKTRGPKKKTFGQRSRGFSARQ
jgi:hypothetical protein